MVNLIHHKQNLENEPQVAEISLYVSLYTHIISPQSVIFFKLTVNTQFALEHSYRKAYKKLSYQDTQEMVF